jgi:hypothetical protein
VGLVATSSGGGNCSIRVQRSRSITYALTVPVLLGIIACSGSGWHVVGEKVFITYSELPGLLPVTKVGSFLRTAPVHCPVCKSKDPPLSLTVFYTAVKLNAYRFTA